MTELTSADCWGQRYVQSLKAELELTRLKCPDRQSSMGSHQAQWLLEGFGSLARIGGMAGVLLAEKGEFLE